MSVIVTKSLRNQLKEDCAHLSDSTRLEPIVFWLSGFGSCRRAVQGSQRVWQRKMATGEQWKAGWACPKIVLKGTAQLPNFLSPGITSWSFYNFEKCHRLVKVSSIHGPLWGHLRYNLWWQCGNWTQNWLNLWFTEGRKHVCTRLHAPSLMVPCWNSFYGIGINVSSMALFVPIDPTSLGMKTEPDACLHLQHSFLLQGEDSFKQKHFCHFPWRLRCPQAGAWANAVCPWVKHRSAGVWGCYRTERVSHVWTYLGLSHRCFMETLMLGSEKSWLLTFDESEDQSPFLWLWSALGRF